MITVKPLEQFLSPMVANRRVAMQTLDQKDILLMEQIKKLKVDVVHQRIDPSEVTLVRPEVVESWIRSFNYGLDLYNYNYGPVVEQSALEELFISKGLLLKAADPYIRQLENVLSSSDCIILLTDENGVMLRVIEGSELLARQNARFRLVTGSVWTEETVGTCAHGLTLIQGTPFQICGPEHYCETYDKISCSSAPIYDAYNNLAGTLCIVTPSFHHQSSQSLGLVVSMAWAVQNEFALLLNNEILSVTLDAADEAVITVNRSGLITRFNSAARQMLQTGSQDLVGRNIEDVVGPNSYIKTVLETGKSVYDAEVEIPKLNQRFNLRSIQAVKDSYGQILGCVITLGRVVYREKRTTVTSRGLEAHFDFNKIVGNSPQLLKTVDMARRFASIDANILIRGESGTGKEVFAQAIHNESRPDGPFVAINCAAIPRSLIETELFGYEGGTFTGAERQGRPGKVELAHGGTLFLDEIGDMPLEVQPVLLRVLEEKRVMRVGSNRYIPVDFRLISATNKDLMDLVQKGLFREDLYYRLKVVEIQVPTLRERGPDIITLAQHFVSQIAESQGVSSPRLSDAAAYRLMQYSWPGNIRELENAMLYAVNTSANGIIQPEDLPEEIGGTTAAGKVDSVLTGGIDTGCSHADASLSVRELEKIAIFKALAQTGQNVSEAAKLLGISRSTLYRRIKEYRLLDRFNEE